MCGVIHGKLLKGAEKAGWGVLAPETQTLNLVKIVCLKAYIFSDETHSIYNMLTLYNAL